MIFAVVLNTFNFAEAQDMKKPITVIMGLSGFREIISV